MIEQALGIFRNRLPAGHRSILFAESVHGTVLSALGRHEEAELLLVESYEGLRASGERAPERLRALQRVINFYEARGQPDKADRYQAVKE